MLTSEGVKNTLVEFVQADNQMPMTAPCRRTKIASTRDRISIQLSVAQKHTKESAGAPTTGANKTSEYGTLARERLWGPEIQSKLYLF